MVNISGVQNAVPSVFSTVTTLSRGVSVPGGIRVPVLLGEGSRIETIITSASGHGLDGLNPAYTSTNGRDGRHFQLSNAPIISNRTTLFKNGIPLVGTEGSIDSDPFSSQFDYRIEIDTGRIELQTAALVDQGGEYYLANVLNVGNGSIVNLELLDVNAPTETWTIRCTSVRRDGYGEPIDGYAKFIAQGSVSGTILNSTGQQVVWQSNGAVVSNGILKFAIDEQFVALIYFSSALAFRCWC
jgi:hypothetical protein